MIRRVCYSLVWAASLVAGCSPDLLEGHYACTSAADCPTDWVCRSDQRCWSTPGSATVDAGNLDASAQDTGVRDADTSDRGSVDVGALDAATPDAEHADVEHADADRTDATSDDADQLDGADPDDGATPLDSGRLDAMPPLDSGTDGGFPDSGFDGGVNDMGFPPFDGGVNDMGFPPFDGGTSDSGTNDSGVQDAGGLPCNNGMCDTYSTCMGGTCRCNLGPSPCECGGLTNVTCSWCAPNGNIYGCLTDDYGCGQTFGVFANCNGFGCSAVTDTCSCSPLDGMACSVDCPCGITSCQIPGTVQCDGQCATQLTCSDVCVGGLLCTI